MNIFTVPLTKVLHTKSYVGLLIIYETLVYNLQKLQITCLYLC